MKYTKVLFILLFVCYTYITEAQVKTPAPSTTATLTQTVGLSKVSISYSRPNLRGRVPFVDVESYGKKWRTGANAATTFEFDTPVNIGGKTVPAGKYALYTIPGKTEWIIVFNKDTSLGGAVGNYKDGNDVARFKVKSQTTPFSTETFTITLSDIKDDQATVNLSWGKINVPFDLKFDTDAMVMKEIKRFEKAPMASLASSHANIASYYLGKKIELPSALSHINKALEIRPDAFWWMHTKAKVLAASGKKKEAIAAAKLSLEKAKANKSGDFGYVARNETLLKELK